MSNVLSFNPTLTFYHVDTHKQLELALNTTALKQGFYCAEQGVFFTYEIYERSDKSKEKEVTKLSAYYKGNRIHSVIIRDKNRFYTSVQTFIADVYYMVTTLFHVPSLGET